MGCQTGTTNEISSPFVIQTGRCGHFDCLDVSERCIVSQHFHVQESYQEFFGQFFGVDEWIRGPLLCDGRFHFVFEFLDFFEYDSIFFLF